MSGHSKWSTIKHKKAANDKKRGKIFTKIIRELMIAAKDGGSDIEANPRLRQAVLKAKQANMPKDTMDRAIKKGAGELEGSSFEEFTYEGYGPHGVAIFMDIMTDNKNRTAGEVRSTLTKSGGNLGSNGCVSFMFDKKGVIVFSSDVISEDKAMEMAIEAGAEDVSAEEDEIEIITDPQDFDTVLNAFLKEDLNPISSEITMIANSEQELESSKIESVLNLIDKLEDLDDVQNVYTNLKIPDDYEV